jgi:hypothetical protein
VSRGGSSMLFSCFALGIVLSISRGSKVDELETITNETENKTEDIEQQKQ